MGSNVVPDGMPVIAGAITSTSTFGWLSGGYGVSNFTTFSSIGLSAFDNAIITEVQYSELLNSDLIVTCTPNTVILSKAAKDNSSISVLLSTNLVNIDQHLTFQSIVGASFYNNSLYIADSFYNSVYKYDLTALFNDQIYPNGLILTKLIGGTGNAEKKYQFNGIGGITIFNDTVYVLDKGNYAIKSYDLDLNFLNINQHIEVFYNNAPIAIAGSNSTGRLYVGTEQNNIVSFDGELKTYQIVNFANFLKTDENIKNIFTSKNFTNVYFIVTNYNIWKFYASKPQNPIGVYSLYRFGLPASETYSYASSVASLNAGIDDVYILGLRASDSVRTIIKVAESTNFADVLTLPDFEVYTLDDIKVKPDEYTQTWVINKAIQKLALNHVRLKDKIIGRFYGTYDDHNNLLLHGFFYFLLDDLDMTDYNITLDHFIGNNEALLNTVINRGLEKMYNLQLNIIGKSNTIIQDSSTSENQAVFID